MTDHVSFQGAYPIGNTDTQALPVRELGPAIGYYTQVLGLKVVSRNKTTALLRRGDATIGLAVNGADPEQARCYFDVQDVETLRRELDAKSIKPSPIRIDEHDGKRFRVVFAKEPYGVCFCFGQPEAIAQEDPSR
jgi:hypothetical protein